MSAEISPMSLTALADALAARELPAVEVMETTVARAERLQPVLNCFISLEAESALEDAAAADAALARGEAPGPLHGVPIAHKDMFYRTGQVSTCGSRILRDFVPDHDSTALTRLRKAGAITLGGLNMAEFATGPTGHNEHWGDCRNPWNPDYISGGSSSGSGAAVGGRIAFGALGSDTGGSVRLPAACCGIVGLKPSEGLISRHGIMELSQTMDTVGPLCRTVRDVARMTRVLAGHDPYDRASVRHPAPDYEDRLGPDIRGVRVGVPAEWAYELATDEVRALMNASLAVLRAAGAETVEVSLPDMQRLTDLANVIFTCEAAATARTLAHRAVRTTTRRRCADATNPASATPATRYLPGTSGTLRAVLIREFTDTVFAHADVLHTPALPIPCSDPGGNGYLRPGDAMAGMIAGISWCTRPHQLPRNPCARRALRLHEERSAFGLSTHGPASSRSPDALPQSATRTKARRTGTRRGPAL